MHALLVLLENPLVKCILSTLYVIGTTGGATLCCWLRLARHSRICIGKIFEGLWVLSVDIS